ncbi:MAG: DEAD/DEAH box helicase [Longimicrobiales bacterium]
MDRHSELHPFFYYRHGLAVLRHVRERPPPWMAWDPRLEAHVAPGHRLPELREWARERDVAEGEGGGDGRAGPEPLDGPLLDPRSARDYQEEALRRWREAGGRGSVVLPTGSGKSFLAIMAIHEMGTGACVIAPTRALVSQWFGQLADAFGGDRVGAFYGDEKDPRTLTVTTYHSAFTLLERHGRRFDLLVLDEAHHLADAAGGGAKTWHDALRIAPASRRLGLTATYPDGRDTTLEELVGPVVFRKRIGEMTDAQLADFALERRFVSLVPEERIRYEELTRSYETFVAERGYRERYPDSEDAWKVFMAETRRFPRARRAFRAFLERERLVALARGKIALAERLLALYAAEQSILFCSTTGAAEHLSRRLAIPLITARTPASERKAILDGMAEGWVRAVASVRVLDEGWDVPRAKLGIILGDTSRGGRRQHRQRLGRLLRRQGDRIASLYEIVARDTFEFFASQKRRGGLAQERDGQLGLGV